MVKIAPYGSWQSPISAADVARAGSSPSWVTSHASGVWWTRSIPGEGGRLALTHHDGVEAREVLAAPWNLRNRVHEYGGTPYVLLDTPGGLRVAFTQWTDQRVYLVDPAGGEPVAISAEPATHHGLRYSDLRSGPGGTEVWCVRESVEGDLRRDLVALPVVGGDARVLGASHHFLTSPSVSPDGRHAAWIGWNHPDMPWDGTELCVATVTADGTFGPHRVVAGGPREAVCQVEWETPDSLVALTDPGGWWNLHRIGLDGTVVNLARVDNELGGPMWQLGYRWFAQLGRGRFAVLRGGALAILDERGGTVTDVDSDFPIWSPSLTALDGVVTAIAATSTTRPTVVTLDLSSGTHTELTATEGIPDERYLPRPMRRVFTGPGGRGVPAYVYPPTNPDFVAPDGELPPYAVDVHGGPTASHSPSLNLGIAYLTSRGVGVIAVDHGGSTGYGREFREALYGQWGVVDVQDSAVAALGLAEAGEADLARLSIRGGSAGGWTAAAAITTVDTFACATIMYPVLDVTAAVHGDAQTHDFESRYDEKLIGSLPEHADRYAERSPMRHIESIAGPVLLLQGLEDEVCPPEQADRFVAALDGTGVPHAYLTFAGEQHGFRLAESITAAYEAELSFYGQVFGFTPPGVPVLELRR
ncbi:MAG: prolyl oligopeptidase family serine peptidase [Actinomycetota bacterium]|nr:prolyl oligopeptidase family serine peptidase [Actinomycetota bacterium]